MVKPPMLSLSLTQSSTERSIVSSKGIFVKSDSTSKLAIIKLEPQFKGSLANKNESLIVYSFKVKSVNNGTRNFYSLYVGVLIAYKIGRNGRTPFFTGF